jgi:predicted CXXCH cytochrome family protein
VKRLAILLTLVAAMLALYTGTALANFGPHGGYADDTDGCAACHRAHTSFSSAKWADQNQNTHNALLVSSAATVSEFCYACHGNGAPGASTNVWDGVFDSGPSTGLDGSGNATNGVDGITQLYNTNSSFNGALNGGSFGASGLTSMHNMDKGAATDPMWGAGNSAPAGTNLTCTDCHDPHGSSNYRLLKDRVNGKTVGGYVGASETADPWVVSAEASYPTTGWAKHSAGAAQMKLYKPNYTSPEYSAYSLSVDPATGAVMRSFSGWCAACHTQYDQKNSSYNYGNYMKDGANTVGPAAYHRHPVNVSLSVGVGIGRALAVEVQTSTALPLEQLRDTTHGRDTWDTNDVIGCLTCHRAHGASTIMTGWANAELKYGPTGNGVKWMPVLRASSVASHGVNPNFSSSLLRLDNRGVCEACHNK